MHQQEGKKNKLIFYIFLLILLSSINNKVTSLALKAHNLLKCRGVTRSDFRFYKDKFYLLETNTQPGMTSLSLVPEIASYKGISFMQLIDKIIKDASINK